MVSLGYADISDMRIEMQLRKGSRASGINDRRGVDGNHKQRQGQGGQKKRGKETETHMEPGL